MSCGEAGSHRAAQISFSTQRRHVEEVPHFDIPEVIKPDPNVATFFSAAPAMREDEVRVNTCSSAASCGSIQEGFQLWKNRF